MFLDSQKSVPLVTINNSLLETIHNQCQSQANTDVTIHSGDQTVQVHSVFLKNCSPLLNSLFQFSCLCSQPSEIILPSCFSSVLDSFISLLYTGKASNITKEHVDQLILLSKELAIENIVVSDMKDDIDVDEPNPDRFDLETFNTIKETSVLKLETCISDFKSNETMKLSFPKSRIKRNITNLQHYSMQKFLVGLNEKFK